MWLMVREEEVGSAEEGWLAGWLVPAGWLQQLENKLPPHGAPAFSRRCWKTAASLDGCVYSGQRAAKWPHQRTASPLHANKDVLQQQIGGGGDRVVPLAHTHFQCSVTLRLHTFIPYTSCS